MFDDIYFQFKMDESDLNENEDKTEYDSVKDPSSTKQPPPPCPVSSYYTSHITTSKEETQVTDVNKGKETNTHKTNNGK